MDSRFASLRRLVRLHVSWLTAVLLGKELISKEDLAELKKYGKLSLGDEIGFIEKAFTLGRAFATLKQADYEGLTLDSLSRFEKKKYSNAEKLAIREAKFHAQRHLHVIAEEVVAASSEAVSEASEKLINDVLETMSDEVSAAVAEGKTNKELASRLSSILNQGFKKDWTKFATTELHRAKMRGTAMAIANKVDIYSKSKGPNSDVSVVPNKGACKDCLSLYLDEDKNPKVFKLKDMLKKGTNVKAKHTRNKQGIHSHWRAVLPPAHPNCYCTLVYVPPGMKWEEGKLVVADMVRYNDHITKAVDQGSMSPTITPPGPKSTQGPKIPKTRSQPGLPAPGNVPGPGAPKSPTMPSAPDAVAKAPGAPREGMAPCPYGGGPECAKHGGDGAKTHKEGGNVMQAHNEYMSRSGKATTKYDENTLAAKINEAEKWKKKEHSTPEVLDHLQHSDILRDEPLGDDQGFNQSSRKVWLDGNGPALLKPTSTHVNDAHNEVAGYKLFTLLGSDLCPETGLRTVDGRAASNQAWLGDHTTAAKIYKELTGKSYTKRGAVVKKMVESSKDPEKLKKSLSEIAVMDLVINNYDRHFYNVMLNDDRTEAKAIDHGFTFGRGYHSLKTYIHDGMNSNNMRVKISPTMNERFDNTSLTDLKKAIGGNTSDWQVGQTYLRMRYMQHVQEEHGHLPYDEFKHISNLEDDYNPFERASGNEKFEDFAIDFIDSNASNPSSPEYAAAFYLRDIGVLMDPTSHLTADPALERKKGWQYAYEKRARVLKANKDSIKSGKGDFLTPYLEDASNVVYARYKKEVDSLSDKFEALTEEAGKTHRKYQDAGKRVTDHAFGRIKGDEKEIEAAKERAFIEHKEAKEAKDKARDEYDWALTKVRLETQKAREEVYQSVIPEGHEKTFNRLNAAIDRSAGAKQIRRTVQARDYSHLRSKQYNKAAEREKAKRSENDVTEKIDRDG